MQTKSQNELFLNIIILFFMLFAVDFFGYGWYIFGATVALVLVYMAFTNKKIAVSNLFLWVIVLAISNYAILSFYMDTDIVTKIIKYLVSPIGGFLIGVVLVKERKHKDDSILRLYMYAVIPYLIHGILNLIIFKGFEGFERELADFWTGKMWKATLACTYFAMTVPMAFLAFLTKSKLKKILYILATAVSVYACVVTASRSVLLIGAIVILIELFLYMKEGKFTSQKAKILWMFVLLIILGVILAYVNMDSISQTDLFGRIENADVGEEPRIQLFMNIIDNFWMYPLGNMPYFYSHNTWLDFLRESGWITFFCFIVITVITIKHMTLVYKNKSILLEHRIAVVGMMTALLLDMFVEPIMDGAAILFCLFFYFIGVNSQFIKAPKPEGKECQN